MKKITFLKVLAYPASAYILFNVAGQPILAQTQEEPVPEVNVEESDTPAVEEAIPEVVKENEDAVIPENAVEMEVEADTGDEMPEAVIEADQNDAPAYDEDFAKYVEEQFLGKSEEEIVKTPVFKLFKASIAGDNLSATDHEIYNLLKPQLEAVARGETTFTQFEIDPNKLSNVTLEAYTAADLGLDSLMDNDGYISSDATIAYFQKIQMNFRIIYESLQSDMPSDLYWFNKTSSGAYLPTTVYTTTGESSDPNFTIKLKSMTFRFAVSQDYMDKSYDDIYHVDPKYGQSVQNALNNAKKIVDKYADLSDYEKLKAYVKELTELSDYNHPAIDNNQAYGDPWQIIYLFDGDPNTKVVCEGYAKGFQYLCNLSTFKSSELKVLSVHGISGAGTGAGNHEWNLVHMPDGRNYVVDVTNTTSEAIGSGGELILAGTPIGDLDNGYIFKIGNDDFPLQYNEDTRSQFKDAQLVLSPFNYSEANTMQVTVKVDDYNLIEDETINYNIILDPGKANISDIFYDITFEAPGREPQKFTRIQETAFNSVGLVGNYTITVRAYDEKGNETTGVRKFTVAPALTVSLINDHSNETLVDTDYVLTADAEGKATPILYQFQQYRLGQWEALSEYREKETCVISVGTPGTYTVRVVAKDEKGHTAVSNQMELTVVEGVKPSISVENLYYKIGQTINLKDAITINSDGTFTYFTKIVDNKTGQVVDTIPNNKQNDFTVDYTFLDSLKRMVSHLAAKVYVIQEPTYRIGDKHAAAGIPINLLDGVSVIDSNDKVIGPDSGQIHIQQVLDGPQSVDANDTISFPVKGIYTVKYSFKDSLGINWTAQHQVNVHDPINIECTDIYSPVDVDIDLLNDVKGTDEDGNVVGVVVKSIANGDGEMIESIDTSELGVYTITYGATDKYGIETTKTAKCTVKKPPVISDALTVTPVNSEIDLLDYVKAYDDKGNELKVELISIQDETGKTLEEWYTDTPQILTCKYYAEDSDGVWTEYVEKLRIKALPTINAQNIEIYQGETFYLEEFISAADADGNPITPIMDGIIDDEGQLVDDWAVLNPGDYPVTIYAKDKDGIESSMKITVTILYNDLPEIDADDVWLEVGDDWDPYEDVTASDKQDGDLTEKVEIVSVKKRDVKPKLMKTARIPVDIDTSEPGIYDIVYRVVDKFGGETIKAIVVTITEKAPEPEVNQSQGITETNVSNVVANKGVPTGIDLGMMGYVNMLVTSLGSMMALSRFRRRQK